MPKPGKKEFNGQLGIRCSPEITADLLAIRDKHGYEPVELTRRLLQAACLFYRHYGFFSFPIAIIPDTFQAGYIAEAQAHYEAQTKAKGGKKPKALLADEVLRSIIPLLTQPAKIPAESQKGESSTPSHSAG